jgi:hypothetical protein
VKGEIKDRHDDGRKAIVITLLLDSVRTAHQAMRAEATLAI